MTLVGSSSPLLQAFVKELRAAFEPQYAVLRVCSDLTYNRSDNHKGHADEPDIDITW